VKRIVKRLAIGFSALIFLLCALAFVGFRWGLTPLPKPPEGVRIRPLLAPIPRESLRPDNGAFYYMQAVDFLGGHQLSKEQKDQIEALAVGVFQGDTNAFEQTFAQIRPALDLIRKGSQAPTCQMPQLAENDTTTLGLVRQLARLLIAEGKLAQRNGDSARALEDYFGAAKFASDSANGGPMVVRMVGDAILGMSMQAIRAWALQVPDSQEHLQNIITQIDRLNQQYPPFAETLRCELQYSKELVVNSMKLEKAGVSERISFNRQGLFSCSDAAFGELIQDADKPYWKSNAQGIIQKWDISKKSPWSWALNRPIPRILLEMLLPTVQSIRVKAVRADLEFEATSVVCALKSYQSAHGAPPEQLADLVPTFLLSLPIDPFDGKPLRYRSDGTNWVIWSVGSDLKDDNAEWHEFKYRKRGEERTGGDIYFKSTEPQDDLAFYVSQKDSKSKR